MQLTCESPETGVAEVWLALLFLAYLVVDLVVHSYTFAHKLRCCWFAATNLINA